MAGLALLLTLALGLTGRFAVLTPWGRTLISGLVNGARIGRYGRIDVYGLKGDVWHDFTLDRVTVTLGSPAKGDPKWGAFGICSGKPNYGQFENDFWSISFFPAVYPCRFTAADTAGNLFQFKINSGPQSPGGLKVSCPGDVSNPAWCASAQVVDTQQINAAKPLP